jgi:hypothetical protein
VAAGVRAVEAREQLLAALTRVARVTTVGGVSRSGGGETLRH